MAVSMPWVMAHSTVPQGVAAEAHRYLSEGGPANLRGLHAFLADTILLSGEVFNSHGGAGGMVACQAKHGAGSVITLYRELHAGKLGRLGPFRN